MYKTAILPLAIEDIREAILWYNSKQKGLGKRFTSEVREAIKFITKNPKACTVRYDNTRTTVLRVFPFMIHYTIDKKLILVTAILHTSRNHNDREGDD